MAPILLVDGVQDYGAAPADYLRLVRVRIVRTDVTPHQVFEPPLDILAMLEPNLHNKLTPQDIRIVSYEGQLDKFRVERAVSVAQGAVYELQATYQTMPRPVTNTSNVLLTPDLYFDVFAAGMKWRFMEFANDARAGTTQISGGGEAHNGMKGQFYCLLNEMAETEGFGDGNIVAPSESLMAE